MTESLTRVVLENEFVRAIILPELGGKIASLVVKRVGLELLQQPLHPYQRRVWAQDFAASDASGWDECIPTVSPCEVSVDGEPKEQADHGDIWLLPATWSSNAVHVDLETNLASVPLLLRRRITLSGSSLHVRNVLTNDALCAVPYLWCAHPLFAVDEGDRILLPDSVHTLRVESSANRLSAQRSLCAWPVTEDRNGRAVDLRIAQGAQTGIADKAFAGPLQQGCCGIYRMQQQAGVVLRFAAESLPYLGLWFCYGGWPAGNAARQQAVALEPCMAPMDSLAEALVTGCARTLAAGEAISWQLELRIPGAQERVSYEEFARDCFSSTPCCA